MVASAGEEEVQTNDQDAGEFKPSADLQDEFVDDDMPGMQEVIHGLWIGCFDASQHFETLRSFGISVIIAAMKQIYNVPDDFDLHQIPINDDSRTNVMAHFSHSNDIIRTALRAGKGVLVHCQAGISRSTTLVAAFLMAELSLSSDEAIERISAVRSIVEPTEFFQHQLEMYERQGCEVDPATHPEYRRFLMAFSHADVMDGVGDETLYLAYYPSPALTPRDRSPSDPFRSLRMTPVEKPGAPGGMSMSGFPGALTPLRRTGSVSSPSELGMISSSLSRRSSAGAIPISRKPSGSELENWSRERRPSRAAAEMVARQAEALRNELNAVREGGQRMLKIGQGRVIVKGKRLRCKMCSRELAAREHLIEHEPGEGQSAFAIYRQDMALHRQERQKKLEEEAEKAARKAERERTKAELRAMALTHATPIDSTPTKAEQTVKIPSSKALSSEGSPVTPLTEAKPSMSNGKKGLIDRLPPQLASLRLSMPPAYRFPAALESDSALDTADTPSEAPEPSPPLLKSSSCSAYFVEPLSWMSDMLEGGNLGGRIVCPNKRCGQKLGAFDWAGLQCGCGSWVVPGFSLTASKVDEIG